MSGILTGGIVAATSYATLCAVATALRAFVLVAGCAARADGPISTGGPRPPPHGGWSRPLSAIEMTMNAYAHVNLYSQRDALDSLDDGLSGPS
jgi:hypothetical protein